MASDKRKKAISVPLPRGIRLLKNGKYIVDVTVNGTRKTGVTKNPNDIDEALLLRDQLQGTLQTAEANGGGNEAHAIAAQGGWTIKQAYEKTNYHLWRGKASEKTNKINSYAAIDFFGENKLIRTICQEDIDDYIEHLEEEEGNSDATINRKMSALGVIFRFCKGRNQVTTPPELPRREEMEGRIRFFTQEEEKQILKWFAHFDKPDHREAVIVLIDTGFRTGELWGLTAAHVNLANNTLTLWKTKNKKPRTVPMTGRVRQIIIHRMHLYPEGKLFPGSSKTWMRAPWAHVRRAMKMDDDPFFVPHSLRHTCCSRLVQRGVPLTHVMKWMGHKRIETTMRYAHLAPQDLFGAVKVLDSGSDLARWGQDASIQGETVEAMLQNAGIQPETFQQLVAALLKPSESKAEEMPDIRQ